MIQIPVRGCCGVLLLWLVSPNISSAEPASPSSYSFGTLAGYVGLGSADGVGDRAQFSNPWGVVVNDRGNIYVADTQNHTIREITPSGVVTTIVGRAGVPGSTDGNGSTALLNSPYGITIDSAGTLYVTDMGNSAIRTLTHPGTNWIVNTLVGSIENRLGFGSLRGIASAKDGTLFVTDYSNNSIERVAPDGRVTRIAGGGSGNRDGAGADAEFSGPLGIALDANGVLYVVDQDNLAIRQISLQGSTSTVTTIATFGNGIVTHFSTLEGIAVDRAGDLYVPFEQVIYQLHKSTAGTWSVTSFAGGAAGIQSPHDGAGLNAAFSFPRGLAADGSGNIYVVDLDTIRTITSAGVVATLAGAATPATSANGTGSNARFVAPFDIAVDTSGNVYLPDNYALRKVTPAGVVTTLAGLPGTEGSIDGPGDFARFGDSYAMATDAQNNIYMLEASTGSIRKITPAGLVTTIVPHPAGIDASALDGRGGGGLVLDRLGRLFIADYGHHTIRKIEFVGTNWILTTIAGKVGAVGTNDGPALISRFSSPSGIAIDADQNLYVADQGNNTIRQLVPIGPDWVVSTLAGSPAFRGHTDGTGTESRFSGPNGIAVDSAGSLFVADTYNNTIRKITRAGTNSLVNTIAGRANIFGNSDGPGSTALFNSPYGVAVDSSGILYVADTANALVRKGLSFEYTRANPAPYVPPAMNGELTVVLTPPEARGQWRFPWEIGWRESGTTATNLATGNYTVEFRNIPGYLALPVQPVQVESGQRASITNEYLLTLAAGDANSGSGSLTVFLGPTPPTGAGWRFVGSSGSFFSTGFTTNMLPGVYLIEFAAVNGRIKPASQAVLINPGGPSFLSVNYLLTATRPDGAYTPHLVPDDQLNDETNFPFGFNGQLRTDTGFGSGVAVQPNVVLTAAHLVFDDQTLSYVSRAHWFFRRSTGVNEPLPQEARGYYVLSGYAAQRTNDLASGYVPDQSTPPSRNADVATLYFLSPAAGGGHGGYLPSDETPNTWLSSTALKMLVGYPVDGSIFGEASIIPGRMYQTDPQPFPLTLAPDPVPGQQQVYLAPWLLSYPGNSGGPFYVQLNGYYYPAGVYLGTLFSGSKPYASVIRAINSEVVDLISRAQSQGDAGTNSTGGGVITIIPSQAISTSHPGYLQWQLGPPAAINAGAAWRVVGDSTYSTKPNYTRAITLSNSQVEFKMIPGWNLPTNETVNLTPGVLNRYTANYSVINPILDLDLQLGLKISGTPGTTYRIEHRSSLTTGSWLPLTTNLLTTKESNLIWPKDRLLDSNTFFRAVWLGF